MTRNKVLKNDIMWKMQVMKQEFSLQKKYWLCISYTASVSTISIDYQMFTKCECLNGTVCV